MVDAIATRGIPFMRSVVDLLGLIRTTVFPSGTYWLRRFASVPLSES